LRGAQNAKIRIIEIIATVATDQAVHAATACTETAE
jgi:hypothetical protein